MLLPSATFDVHAFTTGERMPPDVVSAVRGDLRTNGFAVVRLYAADSPQADAYEEGMDGLARELCPDGGSANGGRGMGGITKTYGAGCHPAAAAARLDDRAREVHARIYGVEKEEVMSGWDAVACLGADAARERPPTQARLEHPDARVALLARTGGTLEPHVDVSPGDSAGARMEKQMETLHPIFSCCVQSQLVCRTVPRGGATLVVAPGAYADAPPDARLFGGRDDFQTCTPAGYEHFRDAWRAVDGVERGCLILWLSRTPHTNKLADPGVDPRRRVVYIAWQARALVPEAERRALRQRKLDAVYSGATTDHWSTQAKRLYRGSHYSNAKKRTKVLYDGERRPEYSEELAAKIQDAF